MKYIGYLIALGTVIYLTLQKHQQYPSSALMKATIFDEQGDEVWSSSSFGEKCVEIENGIPQISLGKEAPLFESYLEEVNAKKLSIWLDYGSGYQHYVDYGLKELTLTPLENKQIKKSSHKSQTTDHKKDVKIKGKLDLPENPLERQQWRLMQKGGEIDPEKRKATKKIIRENIERIKKENKTYLRDAGVANWTSMGPNNIGGRVRAIAIHPENTDIIYLGSAGGGIWKSTNGGNSWTNLDDYMGSLVITSIVIDHKTPSTIYASTGEGQRYSGTPGEGVFRSIDNGLTWKQLSETAPYSHINKLEMDPLDSEIIYAALTIRSSNSSSNANGNILRTEDGGGTWDLLLASGSSNAIMDIEISESYPDLIFASGYDAYWRSTNGGATWTNQLGIGSNPIPSGVRRIEIETYPSNENIVYALVHKDSTGASTMNNEAYRCLLYYSENGGINWELKFEDINTVFPQSGFGDYSNTIWVNPTSSKLVYFGGVDLWFSSQHGASAKEVSDWKYYHQQTVPDSFSLHGDHHIIIPHPNFDGDFNRTVFFGNDGGIQKTNDIDNVDKYDGWINLLNQSIGITQFYSGAVSPSGTLFGGGAQDNSFSTGTGPSNWQQSITGDGAYMAINPSDTDTIFANTNYNRLWMSTNAGNSWFIPKYKPFLPNQLEVDLPNLETDGAKLIAPMAMDRDIHHLIYRGGENLFRYNAATKIQDTIKLALTGTISPAISTIASDNNGQTIWVGYTNGVLQFSTNGGTNWSPNINPAGNFYNQFFITDIDITSNGTQVIITIAGNHGGGSDNHNIFRYDVQADNWTNISMEIDLQVNCVSHHPFIDDWIYVGTDLGIFTSEDNGTSWSTTPLYGPAGSKYGNEGPIYTEVTDLFWNWHPQGSFNGVNPKPSLWATTFGRGLWKSNWIIGKYYVDRISGNDNNSGNINFPFKTLKKASEVAGNGATIVFKQGNDNNQGTHEETLNILLDKRVIIELNNGPVIIQ